MSFLTLLLQRLSAPTPEFHAKIRNLMAGVVSICTVIVALHPTFVPADAYQYIEFGIAVAAGIGIQAQTTSTKH